MKLKEKRKDENGHVTKVYETSQTPYQRVLESATISEATKQQLRVQYEQLNPAALQRNLKKKLDNMYRLMKEKQLTSSVTSPYHATPLPDHLLSNI